MAGIQSAIGQGPGIKSKFQSDESQVWWGHENLQIKAPMPAIAAATVDAGNTVTTNLRGGLVMARLDASPNLWMQYDPAQTDGREVAAGVLESGVSMLGEDGQAIQKQNGIFIGGLLKAGELHGLDSAARIQLSKMFVFDDDPAGRGWGGAFLREVAKAANYTVLAGDNFVEFVATAASVFTLPAIGKGYRFKFRNQADTNMGVASAEGDNMVAMNDASADSVTFQTAGELIGGAVVVYSNKAGDKWIVENVSAGANTLTVAT